jgi:hypothetical protein
MVAMLSILRIRFQRRQFASLSVSRILPFIAAINSGSITRTRQSNDDRSPVLLDFTDSSVSWPTLSGPKLLERHFFLPFVESILGGLSVRDKFNQTRAAVVGSAGIGMQSQSFRIFAS